MLRGVELLSDDEFLAIGELIEVDLKPAANRSQLLLDWMARVVGAEGESSLRVERSVLEWIAQRWSIPFQPSLDNNDLERLIRRRIATEATQFLAPAWRVACALMVEDVSNVAGLKMDMLTKAAEKVVPSNSILETYRQEWKTLSKTWTYEDPRPALKDDLDVLAKHQGLARQALQLGLVIAFADGRLSKDEERLVAHIGAAVGLSADETSRLTTRLNQAFCDYRDRISKEKSLGLLGSSVEAAEQTLADSEIITGFCRETRETVLEELEPEEDRGPVGKPQGWSKLLGALSGIAHFFSSRVDEEDPGNLVRVFYLTMQKQRAEVTGG